MNHFELITTVVLVYASSADAGSASKKLEQLESMLPAPNVYRTKPAKTLAETEKVPHASSH